MVIALLFILFFILLYHQGWLPVSFKRAAVYVGSGSWKSRCVGATFTACSGKIQRVVRFPESRSYSFRLSGHIQQGSVRVQLLSGKLTVLELSSESNDGVVNLEAGRAYTLCTFFDHASGDYLLEWD